MKTKFFLITVLTLLSVMMVSLSGAAFTIPDYRHLGYRFGTNLVDTVVKRGIVYPVRG